MYADFAGLMAAEIDAQSIAVDIPIGLAEDSFRDCDLAARARLRGRASSLFLMPPAAAFLDCSTYETALQRCREMTDSGISKQAFALRAKILDVDAHALDPRVHEVHPEVSFLEMNEHQHLPRKKSWAGMTARRTLLARNGIDLPDDLGPAGAVPPDDILDAAAAAWSAARISRGVATRLPTEDTQLDRRGRPIAIWA